MPPEHAPSVDGPPGARRLLASPRFMLFAALMSVGLVGMYLVAFLIDDVSVPWSGAAGAVLLILVGLGILVIGATSKMVGRLRLVDVTAATAAGAMAQFLTREMGMPLLVAGSMIAVVVGLMLLWDGPLDPLSAGAAYAGICVGLLPSYVTQSSWLVIVAAAVCGVLWSFVGPSVWDGIGGRMGLAAFIAGSLVYLAADILGLERNHRLIPLRLDGLAHWAVVPVGAIAAVLTWVLIDRLDVPFVLASGSLSLVVCLTLDITKPVPASVLDVAFFGGTFVGGTAAYRLPNAALVATAGALFGLLMLHFRGPLTGHVGVIGATGTTACLAVAALVWLSRRVGWAPQRVVRRSGSGAIPGAETA